jgi:uncharacterized repeat protein (TIGR01451 family)
VILGLAVTAHDNNVEATGVFSGFNVTAPVADLVLKMTASSPVVPVGGSVTYTLNITNVALVGGAGATISDPLPAGMSYTSGTTTAGTISEIGGVVTVNLGALAPGEGALVQIVATPTAPGTKVNTVTASLSGSDSNPGNNTATVTISVPATPVMTAPSFSGGAFRFSLATENGLSYAVQYKHNLSDATWTNLQVIVGNGSVIPVADSTPAPDQRFYRVIIQ